MFSLDGIFNALWCILAFGIVACAVTPMPLDKHAGIIVSNDGQAIQGHAAAVSL